VSNLDASDTILITNNTFSYSDWYSIIFSKATNFKFANNLVLDHISVGVWVQESTNITIDNNIVM